MNHAPTPIIILIQLLPCMSCSTAKISLLFFTSLVEKCLMIILFILATEIACLWNDIYLHLNWGFWYFCLAEKTFRMDFHIQNVNLMLINWYSLFKSFIIIQVNLAHLIRNSSFIFCPHFHLELILGDSYINICRPSSWLVVTKQHEKKVPFYLAQKLEFSDFHNYF